MQQTNPPIDTRVQELQIMSGLKLVQTEVRIKVPVFEDIEILCPKFVDKQISVPVGFDEVANQMAMEITKAVLGMIEPVIIKKIDGLIEDKVAQMKSIKILEEVTMVPKTVEYEVQKPVYRDIEVMRPVFVDKEITNVTIKDVEVVNAIVVDKPVTNALITNMNIINAIIKDVEVERAVIREKVVDVIHPRYLDLKGNPE